MGISKEQLNFINILADFVNERETVLDKDVSLECLVANARNQQCEAIVFKQTKIGYLYTFTASTYYQNTNYKFLLKNINSVFTENHIPYIVLKGTEISRFSPHPECRSMTDIDILVHEKDKVFAGKLLEEMGYVLQNTCENAKGEIIPNSANEWVYLKDTLDIELHHRLIYDEALSNEKIFKFSDGVWDFAEKTEGEFYRLNINYHFVYLLIHLRKHIMWMGTGIRPFIDLAFILRQNLLDWEIVEKELDNLSILPFAKVCFGLIYRWFGVSAGIAFDEIDEEFFVSATDSVLFANENFPENEEDDTTMMDNNVVNRIDSDKNLFMQKAKITLENLFPKYSKLCVKYKSLKKFGFFGVLITPLMWIHRFIGSLLRSTVKKSLNSALRPFDLDNSSIKQRQENLSKWGINE